MKASELRELSDVELATKLDELRTEGFKLRFRSATESIDNPIRFRTLRRDIARIRTLQRERALRAGSEAR